MFFYKPASILAECPNADGGAEGARGSDRAEATAGESQRGEGRRVAAAGQAGARDSHPPGSGEGPSEDRRHQDQPALPDRSVSHQVDP